MNNKQKKYTFTNETIEHAGVQLRRIKRVSDGELGGFIEKEENLSHEGDAWVYENARVFGNARIYGDAWVCGDAQVYGNARVYENAQVFEDAQVYGYAQVYGNARVYGTAQVYGYAQVFGYAQVYGNARVFENAQVSGYALVCGDAQVYENARVYGNALVFENALVFGNARVSGYAQVYGNISYPLEKEIKNPMNKTKNGKKFDSGKSRMSLIPFTALRALGDVYTLGAQKYEDNNWLKGMKWSRLQDAMLRHYERFASGEDIDPETQLYHSAQMAWNAIGLLTYQLLDLGEDDRWKEKADYVPADIKATQNKSFEELDPDGTGDAE